jgi:hypothetical protein
MPEERTKNTMVPWDSTFPKEVVHAGTLKHPHPLWLEVKWYGMESTLYGSVPVVAFKDGYGWFAGESDVIDDEPTLVAINGYGDEATALDYVSDRKKIWTL